MNISLVAAQSIRGRMTIPGDKSISHRALMLGAIARGETVIRGLAPGEDVRSTMRCLRQLGVLIQENGNELRVQGGVLKKTATPLDAGNSGTTMRLLSGILAAQPFSTTITGDASLQRRPMRRIIEPLAQMGATISSRENGCAPLTIHGSKLRGIHYQLPVASAQVKSCVLLAGLHAAGETVVEEKIPTRDHSERLLRLMGAEVSVSSGQCSVISNQYSVISNQYPVNGNTVRIRAKELGGCQIEVPGDFSSAAFFIAAAMLLPDSELMIENVGVNPTRTAFLDVLCEMGAKIEMANLWHEAYEPIADLIIRHQALRGTKIFGNQIALLIDEIPILAVLATQAEGETHIHDAGELRLKESDRIAALVHNLREMGAAVEEFSDGLVINGPTKLRGAEIDSFGDHRIAMAFAIAGLLADSPTTIGAAECADISFPGFFEKLRQICV
jgi:3-phosphoshikimate 1-carboxyvinyltransferase